jgi:hypothetical protein
VIEVRPAHTNRTREPIAKRKIQRNNNESLIKDHQNRELVIFSVRREVFDIAGGTPLGERCAASRADRPRRRARSPRLRAGSCRRGDPEALAVDVHRRPSSCRSLLHQILERIGTGGRWTADMALLPPPTRKRTAPVPRSRQYSASKGSVGASQLVADVLVRDGERADRARLSRPCQLGLHLRARSTSANRTCPCSSPLHVPPSSESSADRACR